MSLFHKHDQPTDGLTRLLELLRAAKNRISKDLIAMV